MIDLHHHLLPGVDDGPRTWNETLSMARKALEDGISTVVCTPHWIRGLYPKNTRPFILSAVGKLQQKLDDLRVPLQVLPGCELQLDMSVVEGLESGRLLTLNDTGRYAMIELPHDLLPRNLERFFEVLQARGIVPVVSHPERHWMVIKDPQRLQGWVEMDVLVQITAGSLAGAFGKTVQKTALKLLKHRLVHVLATDAHDAVKRPPNLSQGYRLAEEALGAEGARSLVEDHPRKIIKGEEVAVPTPIPLKTGGYKIFSLKRWLRASAMGSH